MKEPPRIGPGSDSDIIAIARELGLRPTFIEKLVTSLYRDWREGKIKEEQIARLIEDAVRAEFASIASPAIEIRKAILKDAGETDQFILRTIQSVHNRIAELKRKYDQAGEEVAPTNHLELDGSDAADPLIRNGTLALSIIFFLVSAAHMYSLGILHYGLMGENGFFGFIIACSWPLVVNVFFAFADKLNRTFNTTPKSRAVWMAAITTIGFVVSIIALSVFSSAHPWYGMAERKTHGSLLTFCLLSAEALAAALAFAEFMAQRRRRNTTPLPYEDRKKELEQEQKMLTLRIEELEISKAKEEQRLGDLRFAVIWARAGILQLEAILQLHISESMLHGKATFERLKMMLPTHEGDK